MALVRASFYDDDDDMLGADEVLFMADPEDAQLTRSQRAELVMRSRSLFGMSLKQKEKLAIAGSFAGDIGIQLDRDELNVVERVARHFGGHMSATGQYTPGPGRSPSTDAILSQIYQVIRHVARGNPLLLKFLNDRVSDIAFAVIANMYPRDQIVEKDCSIKDAWADLRGPAPTAAANRLALSGGATNENGEPTLKLCAAKKKPKCTQPVQCASARYCESCRCKSIMKNGLRCDRELAPGSLSECKLHKNTTRYHQESDRIARAYLLAALYGLSEPKKKKRSNGYGWGWFPMA